MRRLMDWFAARAAAKLRRSQIKILYQNQCAIEYLKGEFEVAVSLGTLPNPKLLDSIQVLEDMVCVQIIDLTARDFLPDEEVQRILYANSALKDWYAGLLEARRKASAMQGKSSEDLMPFASRFRPAAGWENISDTEWDRMVKRALQ